MSHKYYLTIIMMFSFYASAEELRNAQTIFFEKKPEIQPEFILTPDKNSVDSKISKMNINLSDCINLSIPHKDWVSLEICLNKYKKMPNYDEVLYRYGLGALYYSSGDRNRAIKIYQELVSDYPNLTYPRFDLAMMLFQDKRYNEAEKELKIVQSELSPDMKNLVNSLLSTIKKSEKWITTVNVNFEKTNNVNQASDLKNIIIGDAVFIRDKEALPQKAEGLGYNINISKEKSINRNHYLSSNFMLNGIYYWDNNKYSEQTYRLDVGYKNKSFESTWGITPFLEQNTLDNTRYNYNYGLSLDLNRKFSDNLQISTNVSRIMKRYQDENLADIYNGSANSQVILMIYQPKMSFIFYSGIDAMQDHLKDISESSKSYGIRGGTIYTSNILSARTNIRYAQRNFDELNIWYKKKREDKTVDFSLTIWKQQLQWNNFSPKLNYKFQNVDSSLDLYTRKSNSFFLTIEKDF